jgi:CMP-N,N'-diacetyllegionaminic acid synthase
MRFLGLVPARGGSKGIPHKNIRLLAGKPLLQYTAEAALLVQELTRVILSTDDPEIAAVGKACGLDVPFLRPAELAADDTPTLAVIRHALRWLEENGESYDAVCLLQPTNPLRNASIIKACIQLFVEKNADSVFTVLPVPHPYNPHWVYFPREDGSLALSTGEAQPIPRRQALPPAYHREGSVYITRRDVILLEDSLYGSRSYGYQVDAATSVNLDTMDDWRRAEQMMSGK